MENWDDHRFFLAVAREVSVKKAAEVLCVNRSTVLRRINAFESRLGVRLFERLPNGYFTTSAGDELLESSQKMETVAGAVGRRIAGRDTQLRGAIRVSLPGVLAAYVLMPDFAEFSASHPEIKLEILTTTDLPDLARREADIAIRISNDPPDDLVGRRVVKLAKAAYISANHPEPGQQSPADQRPLEWIGWSLEPSSLQWVKDSEFPDRPVGTVVTDPAVTVKAIEAGMGISILPCFMGDREPGLRRLPRGKIRQTDMWVLTHQDMRNTARIRKLAGFITDALVRHRDLLEGRCERLAQS